MENTGKNNYQFVIYATEEERIRIADMLESLQRTPSGKIRQGDVLTRLLLEICEARGL